MYSQSDWGPIHNINSNGINYPRDATTDGIQRNKIVLNSRGGTFEIIDTHGIEKIKMSNYAGSYFEIGNHVTHEGVVNNKTTIIGKDSFMTIKGTRNISTNKDSDENIGGDRYVKVGAQDAATIAKYKEWYEIDSKLAKIVAAPLLIPTIPIPNPSIKTKEIKITPTSEKLVQSLPKSTNKTTAYIKNYLASLVKIPSITISVPVGLKLEPANSPSVQGGAAIPSPTA